MFRVVLGERIRLCQLRDQFEQRAALHLKDNADFQRLQQVPGTTLTKTHHWGPGHQSNTCAQDPGRSRRPSPLRPSPTVPQVLRLDLSTQPSGQFRGATKLSKYGNARLRSSLLDGRRCRLRGCARTASGTSSIDISGVIPRARTGSAWPMSWSPPRWRA